MRHRIAAAPATTVSVAAIVAGCSGNSSDDSAAPATPSSTAPATTTARPNAGSSRYRDGYYQAKGWYGGLPSNIDVAITLRTGRITDVQVTANATDPTSLEYQERFVDAVPDAVVGKPLDEVRVSRLAGSSGTPEGFNDAIEKIKDRGLQMTDGTATFVFDAIGTRWEIETDRPLGDDLRARIRDHIDRFDTTWSRFRPDSLVSRIASAPHGGRFRLPDDATALLDIYDPLHELTDGALDPLIGRDLELLGYDPSYSLTPATHAVRQREHQRRSRWPDIQRDGTTITTDRPVLLDVGAAGKGRLIDLVAHTLNDADVHRFVVDAGGDLRHNGDRHLRVGLEHHSIGSAWSESSTCMAMRCAPRPSTAVPGETGCITSSTRVPARRAGTCSPPG
jgi:uncharacterized protein with FMN-binding domain